MLLLKVTAKLLVIKTKELRFGEIFTDVPSDQSPARLMATIIGACRQNGVIPLEILGLSPASKEECERMDKERGKVKTKSSFDWNEFVNDTNNNGNYVEH